MLGTNDAKEFNWIGVQNEGDSYEKDYKEMIKNFKDLPSNPKVYLMVPPPLKRPYPYKMNKTVINEVYPKLIRKIAKESEAEDEVIDILSLGNSI